MCVFVECEGDLDVRSWMNVLRIGLVPVVGSDACHEFQLSAFRCRYLGVGVYLSWVLTGAVMLGGVCWGCGVR